MLFFVGNSRLNRAPYFIYKNRLCLLSYYGLADTRVENNRLCPNSPLYRSSECNNFLTKHESHLKKSFGFSSDIQYRTYYANSFINSIARSEPVLKIQDFLISVHDSSGLPWWATILISTFLLRTLITLPLTIHQHKITAKLQNLQPTIKEVAIELKKETAVAIQMFGWSEQEAKFRYNKSLRKHIGELIAQNNCHPFKTVIVGLVQFPLWIGLSFALRNLVAMQPYQDAAAQVHFLELSVGGTLWFSNLILPDLYFLLPVLMGIINFSITEIHVLTRLNPTKLQKAMTYFFRGLIVVMIPVSALMPSCLTWYWTVSSFLGLGQNMLLYSPNFRRLVGIPITSTESATPYQDMLKRISSKMPK